MLPNTWVTEIFKRMGMHYGSRLDTMWAGQDPAELHRFWASELSGLETSPEIIAHALDHLPEDRPPSLGEFKRLCAGAPRAEQKRLPAPKANSEFVAKVMREMREAAKSAGGPKAWAHRLRLAETSGERLTSAQRSMWRAALKTQNGIEA
jgi:hypothetical protein